MAVGCSDPVDRIKTKIENDAVIMFFLLVRCKMSTVLTNTSHHNTIGGRGSYNPIVRIQSLFRGNNTLEVAGMRAQIEGASTAENLLRQTSQILLETPSATADDLEVPVGASSYTSWNR